MSITDDKTLNLCFLALFAHSAKISSESVKEFLKTNEYKYDQEILEYYLENASHLLTTIESELLNVVNTVNIPTAEVNENLSKVIEQKKEEIKAEPLVDFSAFF